MCTFLRKNTLCIYCVSVTGSDVIMIKKYIIYLDDQVGNIFFMLIASGTCTRGFCIRNAMKLIYGGMEHLHMTYFF